MAKQMNGADLPYQPINVTDVFPRSEADAFLKDKPSKEHWQTFPDFFLENF